MSVLLKCEIDANPKSKPIWIKDGEPNSLKQEREKISELQMLSEGMITFPSIKVSNSGWYRCTTSHEFGNFASLGYYLNVRSKFQLFFLLYRKVFMRNIFSFNVPFITRNNF